MLELLESLLCCLARHFFFFFFPLVFSSFLSGCNNDVLFHLRVSSLTEPVLYKERKITEVTR